METISIKVRNSEQKALIMNILDKYCNEINYDLIPDYKVDFKHNNESKGKIEDLAGVWADYDIDINQIREKAWKRV
ncbi:MAG TPA: hypothetical protein PKY56_11715 [Candidatus Kapabacteria bacterium]|mgnify:CR=1 FL=1|nr:hypothetical protein [Candidatus Kapabacteria bacterium]HPO63806.1 hypothetical protein [Candidatus Kapabacteria bacterium]